MAPFLVQAIVTIVFRAFAPWSVALRIGLAAMFAFTGASHFSSLKYDLAAMIPPPLTGSLWIIYLTGAAQFAGAIGLMTRRLRAAAAWSLAVMLIALFPANVHAALSNVMLSGAPPANLWLRTPLQLFWMVLLVRVARTASAANLSATGYRAVDETRIRAVAVRTPGASPVSVQANTNSSPNRAMRG